MYDELERSVTRRPPRRISVLGWLGIGAAVLALIGIGGSVWAFHAVRTRVADLREHLGTEALVTQAFSSVVSHAIANAEPTRLAMDHGLHRGLLATLQSVTLDPAAEEDLVEGAFRLRTEERAITADLRGNRDGGRLVIGAPGRELRFDLVRDGEGGGELVIQADGEIVRLGAGGSAHDLPAWIPRAEGMSESPTEIFSARSGDGDFAIVTWETDEAPEVILAAYRNRLERQGFDVRAEHSLRSDEGSNGSITGTHEASERVVFLTTSRDGDSTRIVLGYGEGGSR